MMWKAGTLPGQVEALRQQTRAVEQQARVLEEAEQREVGDDGNHETEPAAPRISVPPQHSEPGEIADQRRERHERAEAIVPEAVEHVARDRQPDVTLIARLQAPEHQIRDWQERVEEHRAVEEQYGRTSGRGAYHTRDRITASERPTPRPASGSFGQDLGVQIEILLRQESARRSVSSTRGAASAFERRSDSSSMTAAIWAARASVVAVGKGPGRVSHTLGQTRRAPRRSAAVPPPATPAPRRPSLPPTQTGRRRRMPGAMVSTSSRPCCASREMNVRADAQRDCELLQRRPLGAVTHDQQSWPAGAGDRSPFSSGERAQKGSDPLLADQSADEEKVVSRRAADGRRPA